jgi:Phage protein
MAETLPQEIGRLVDQVGPESVMRELGVHRTTIMRWRHSKVTIPPAQLMALRALAYAVGTDPAWEGWRFRSGKLWSPEGYSFTPGELQGLPYKYGLLDSLREENRALRNALGLLERAQAAQAQHAQHQLPKVVVNAG